MHHHLHSIVLKEKYRFISYPFHFKGTSHLSLAVAAIAAQLLLHCAFYWTTDFRYQILQCFATLSCTWGAHWLVYGTDTAECLPFPMDDANCIHLQNTWKSFWTTMVLCHIHHTTVQGWWLNHVQIRNPHSLGKSYLIHQQGKVKILHKNTLNSFIPPNKANTK